MSMVAVAYLEEANDRFGHTLTNHLVGTDNLRAVISASNRYPERE